jgi:NADH:ubiquinone oxidoreductase subunit 6 (subunit J)
VNIVDLLFYFFATLSVGGGVLMVVSRHPVSAAMFMIISLGERGRAFCFA